MIISEVILTTLDAVHILINLLGIISFQELNTACSKSNRQFKPILNSPARHQVLMLNHGILSTGF